MPSWHAPTLRGFNWQRSAVSPCRFLALSGHSNSACECAISRVKQILLFAPQMSAFGPKRTCLAALHMSAFGGKADIDLLRRLCPLLTQSGHRRVHCTCQLLTQKRTCLVVLQWRAEETRECQKFTHTMNPIGPRWKLRCACVWTSSTICSSNI
jgi:hypothetical protein